MNKQCLEHLVKLTAEMGLTAKSDQYQMMLQEVNARLAEMDEYARQRQLQQQGDDVDMLSAPKERNAMSGTHGMGPAAYAREQVEAPSLHVGGSGKDMVQKGMAGAGGEDIWAGVDDDIDLGD